MRLGIEMDIATAIALGTTPPAGGAEMQWGYRPSLPDGWTLVENQSLGELSGQSFTMYRNCTGVWLNSTLPWNHDLIFIDCDLRGGSGKFGDRISFYGCRFGERSDGDAIQTSGVDGRQSTDWLFQGCTVRDITTPAASHPDGLEIYGLNGITVRYCYFNNINIETIICQPYQGNDQNNENVLIERCYFGPDYDGDGGTTDIKIADTSGGSWNFGPVRVREQYGGSVSVYPLSAANGDCTAETPLAREDWPYPLLRPDGWLDY